MPQHKHRPILNERDATLCHMLYRYGFLAQHQIDRWLFNAEERAYPQRQTYRRLRKLRDAKYIRRFSPQDDYRFKEVLYCLAKRGLEEIIKPDLPASTGIVHIKQPPRGRIEHDILLNELIYGFEQAFNQSSHWQLTALFNQFQLYRLTQGYPVTYLAKDGQHHQKTVVPDLFLQGLGLAAQPCRLIIEFENNSRNPAAIVAEKITPLAQWLLSNSYQQHFGANAGRVLLIANTSLEKFNNIRQRVWQAGGSRFCLLARFADCRHVDLLQAPIWWLAYRDTPLTLVDYLSPSWQQNIAEEINRLDLPHVALVQ